MSSVPALLSFRQMIVSGQPLVHTALRIAAALLVAAAGIEACAQAPAAVPTATPDTAAAKRPKDLVDLEHLQPPPQPSGPRGA